MSELEKKSKTNGFPSENTKRHWPSKKEHGGPRRGVMVMILRCHAGDRGSNPGLASCKFFVDGGIFCWRNVANFLTDEKFEVT